MERAVPILPADDLGVAKQFYVEALGFEVTFEVSEDGKSGLLGLRRGTFDVIDPFGNTLIVIGAAGTQSFD